MRKKRAAACSARHTICNSSSYISINIRATMARGSNRLRARVTNVCAFENARSRKREKQKTSGRRWKVTQSATSFAHKEKARAAEERKESCGARMYAPRSHLEIECVHLSGGISLRISRAAIGTAGTGYVTVRSNILRVVESLCRCTHVRPRRRRWGTRCRGRNETSVCYVVARSANNIFMARRVGKIYSGTSRSDS